MSPLYEHRRANRTDFCKAKLFPCRQSYKVSLSACVDKIVFRASAELIQSHKVNLLYQLDK